MYLIFLFIFTADVHVTVPVSSVDVCFDVRYHWAWSLPPVTLKAPFDVSCVHFQIEFLIRSHYHFDFSLNEKSDLWHLTPGVWLEELIKAVMTWPRFQLRQWVLLVGG